MGSGLLLIMRRGPSRCTSQRATTGHNSWLRSSNRRTAEAVRSFKSQKGSFVERGQTCAGQGLLVPPVFAVLLGSLRVLREIQMAWAICDDVLVDVEESIIVWTMPVSKTDPKSEIVQAKVVVLVRPPVRRIVPVPCLCEVSERVAGSFWS